MAVLLIILSLWGVSTPRNFHCSTKGHVATCWTRLKPHNTVFQCHTTHGWLICLQERDKR